MSGEGREVRPGSDGKVGRRGREGEGRELEKPRRNKTSESETERNQKLNQRRKHRRGVEVGGGVRKETTRRGGQGMQDNVRATNPDRERERRRRGGKVRGDMETQTISDTD